MRNFPPEIPAGIPGLDAGCGFSNPLLPSAARHLPGSQKWGWKKTIPELNLSLSQLGRGLCLSLPAGSDYHDKTCRSRELISFVNEIIHLVITARASHVYSF